MLRLSDDNFVSHSCLTKHISAQSTPTWHKHCVTTLLDNEHQLLLEALECWHECHSEEIDALACKVSTMRLKERFGQCGKEVKESAMKGMTSWVGSECFEEIDCDALTREMEDKALLIIMLMGGDVATVDLLGFSLQQTDHQREKLVVLKLT